MHTMYVPIVLRYVRSILLVSCIFCQKERIHTFTHSSLLDPTTKNLLSPLTPDQRDDISWSKKKLKSTRFPGKLSWPRLPPGGSVLSTI